MSIFDRYPQATLSVDEAIAHLWRKVNHMEHDFVEYKSILNDLKNNPQTINNFSYNTNLTLGVKRWGRLLFRLMDNEGVSVDYSQLQSHCTDGVYIYLFYASNVNDNCKVRKFNIETKTVVAEATITDGGHANGCTYCDVNDKIYFVESNSDKVYVLDPYTLSVEATLHTNMSDMTKAIAYDKDRDLFWITRVTGNQDNHGVYGFKHTVNGLSLQEEFTVLSYGNLGTATQDIEYHNNVIYMMTSKPNNISAISIPDGHLIKSWSISSNECTVGELEGLSCYNGLWLITSNRLSATRGSYNVTQFFHDNFYEGTQANQTCGEAYSKLQKIPISIYVDINSTEFNPDGTEAHPYKEVFEAIDQETCSYKNNARVIVKAGSYDSIGLHDGADVTIEGTTDNACAIRGFFVSSGARLYLKNMRITRNIIFHTDNNYSNLVENGGEVFLQGCWLETGSSGDYNIYVNTGSKLSMMNCTYTDANQGLGTLLGELSEYKDDVLTPNMLITKNNKSAIVLPGFRRINYEDSAVSVTTSFNKLIRQSQRYWQYILLDLTYQGAHIYCRLPATVDSTNGLVTSAEGFAKFHLDGTTNTVTCTHNDLTGLAYNGYIFVN